MIFTEEELRLIAELRDKVSDLLEDEYEKTNEFLITWIRYASNNVKKAEQALRTNKKWRTEFDFPKAFSINMPELEENLPIERAGFDNDGHPVVGVLFDKDVRKLFNLPGGREQYAQYMVRTCEKISQDTRKQYFATNGKVNQFIVIVDVANLIFGQFTSPKVISTISELVRILEDNYPGILRTLFIINTPRMFKVAFNIFKPFFSADTLARLKLYDSNKEQWMKALLENIPPDQLPSFVKVNLPMI